jgi:hypothetical protein
MPRTVVSTAPTALQNPTAATSLTALSAGTAVDPTNGHQFTNAALPVQARRFLMMINNTFAGSKTVTLKQPVFTNPGQLSGGPNHRGGVGGDLVLTCAAAGIYMFTVEIGKYLQPDGSLFVDYAAAMTGNVAFFTFPNEI